MSNYLELVNSALVLLNEGELTQQNFNNTKSLHSTVKLNVKNVVRKIQKAYRLWPFNAAEHTMTLIPNFEEYAWPQDFNTADFNSFYIVKDPSINLETKKLKRINRDDWYNKIRTMDYDKSPDGRGIPDYVFDAHGRGFGVTPSPDKPYEIKFRYFFNPPVLNNWDDECTIPEEWEHVILDGVLYYMKMFKENPDIANMAKSEFQNGLVKMRTELINNYDYIQDTRIDVNIPGSNGR